MIKVTQRTEWRPKTSAFSASGQFCARAGFREETTGLCGIQHPYSPAGQAAGLFASFVTFLSNKEKLDRFLSSKGKEQYPVGRQKILFYFPLGKIMLFSYYNSKPQPSSGTSRLLPDQKIFLASAKKHGIII
jgi:hypothetical protein